MRNRLANQRLQTDMEQLAQLALVGSELVRRHRIHMELGSELGLAMAMELATAMAMVLAKAMAMVLATAKMAMSRMAMGWLVAQELCLSRSHMERSLSIFLRRISARLAAQS